MAETAVATKANGIVEVTVDSAGLATATFTPTEGIVGQFMDSITTLLSTQKVAVGNAALIQRIVLPLAGNVLATQSETGKFGVSGFGKRFLIGA
jgi:hypothetical protein